MEGGERRAYYGRRFVGLEKFFNFVLFVKKRVYFFSVLGAEFVARRVNV